ncbi:MAG: helix-turn-helix domain-containing protein [Candidatus Bathyarchaeia archaeon]
MNSKPIKPILSNELRQMVESKLKINLEGIEDTLNQIFKTQELSLEAIKQTMQSLEQSFTLLSQKWNLQILYLLFLKKTSGFGELKKILGVNSRTLSDKLKLLTQHNFIRRTINQEPPIRVKYSLTERGYNTILLALPFLYYSSGN